MDAGKIILIALIISSLLSGLILVLVLKAKDFKCRPFKYGGFGEDNGYQDPRKIKKL